MRIYPITPLPEDPSHHPGLGSECAGQRLPLAPCSHTCSTSPTANYGQSMAQHHLFTSSQKENSPGRALLPAELTHDACVPH